MAKLSDKYDVEGIPSLVIVEPATGKVITANGRGAVASDPTGENFPWAPKALEGIDLAADEINDAACLLYLSDDVTEDHKTQLGALANEYHNTWKAAGKSRVRTLNYRELIFFRTNFLFSSSTVLLPMDLVKKCSASPTLNRSQF